MKPANIGPFNFSQNADYINYANYTSAKDKKTKSKALILASTIIGTAIPIILLRNKQDAFIKSVVNLDYDLKNIIIVGLGSIFGGLTGGLIANKGKNADKKAQEGIYQAISNIILPTVLADGGLKILKNHKIDNKFAKAAVTILGVGSGMVLGNFLCDKLNKKLFKNKHQKRDMHIKDTFVHIDDLPVCLALNKGKFFHIEKLVPVGSILSGYETGKA